MCQAKNKTGMLERRPSQDLFLHTTKGFALSISKYSLLVNIPKTINYTKYNKITQTVGWQSPKTRCPFDTAHLLDHRPMAHLEVINSSRAIVAHSCTSADDLHATNRKQATKLNKLLGSKPHRRTCTPSDERQREYMSMGKTSKPWSHFWILLETANSCRWGNRLAGANI